MSDSNYRLRETREYLGLDGDAVFDQTGIAPERLVAIESDGSATDIELQRLSRLYGYTVSYLEGTEDRFDDSRVEFLARWVEELSEEDRAEAIRFAHYLQAPSRQER